ncbi:MAG: type II secretion system protein GspM [Sedimentisphaerales bacterium]
MMIRLTRREKLLIIVSAVFIAVWAIYAFVVKPAVARMETLERIIPQKQRELVMLRTKCDEYALLRSSLDDLRAKVASQKEGFKLLPFLESLIHRCDLAENVVMMKPHTVPLESNYRETIVEIKLENLTLSQLVDFLGKVESSKVLIKTRTLHIKRNLTNQDLLDSALEIHSAKLIQS